MAMTAFDVAAKFASAYNYCKGDRCPYASQCNGRKETCKLKDVAMLLRAKEAEIDSLKIMVAGLRDIIEMLRTYTSELEDINGRYRNLVSAFQNGYKPQRKVSHSKKRGKAKPVVPRGKTLADLDGDERYAFDPEHTELPKPKEEMVVI